MCNRLPAGPNRPAYQSLPEPLVGAPLRLTPSLPAGRALGPALRALP